MINLNRRKFILGTVGVGIAITVPIVLHQTKLTLEMALKDHKLSILLVSDLEMYAALRWHRKWEPIKNNREAILSYVSENGEEIANRIMSIVDEPKTKKFDKWADEAQAEETSIQDIVKFVSNLT